MLTTSLLGGEPATRNLNLLGGSDVLAGAAPVTSGDLASLGPVLATVDEATAAPDETATNPLDIPANLRDAATGTQTAPTSVAEAVTPAEAVENAAVLGFHGTIENAGHGSELNGPVHGLTGFGEALGLGYTGAGPNVLSDALAAPDAVLAGANPTTSLAALGSDVASKAAPAGAGLVDSIGGTTVGSGLGPSPVESLANGGVLGFHAAIEGAGDNAGLPGPVHGLTGLGEAIGPGSLGETKGGTVNPLTGVLDAPAHLVSGDLQGALAPVATGLGSTVGAAGDLLASAGSGTPIGEGVSLGSVAGIVDGATGAAGIGTGLGGLTTTLAGIEAPVGSTVSGLTGEVGPALNLALQGTALSPLGTDLGGVAAHSGQLADSVLAVPGSVLAGDSIKGGLDGAVDQVSPLSHAAGTVVGDLAGAVPAGAGLSAVDGLVNGAVLNLHAALETTGDNAGLPGPTHGVTNLGETIGLGHLGGTGGSNLLNDVSQAPGAVASGGDVTGGLATVAADAGHVLEAAGQLAGSATSTGLGQDASVAPLTGAVGQVAGVLTGTAPGGGAATSGVVADAQHAVSTVTGALSGGGALPVVGGGGQADGHPVGDASAGPAPATVAVLSGGDQLHFPSLGGAGSDALAGKVLDTVASATHAPDTGAASSLAHVADAILDLHAGAADMHHADPAAHAPALAPALAHGLI